MVKEDAPELLRKELSSPAWKPQLVALSGNTDCYQPAEKKRQLTRRCLEVLLDFRNPVVIITKNHLVTRDIDILSELARYDCIGVTLSLTTLDHRLSSLLEPRASRPARRLAAIKALAEGGVPVGYLQAPMIPGSHRFGSSGDCAGGGESGRDFFRIRRVALAVCGEVAVRAMAGSALSRQETKDSQSRAGNSRRQTQRSELQDAHARRRDFRRADGQVVSASAEKVRDLRKMAEAHDGALSQAGKKSVELVLMRSAKDGN